MRLFFFLFLVFFIPFSAHAKDCDWVNFGGIGLGDASITLSNCDASGSKCRQDDLGDGWWIVRQCVGNPCVDPSIWDSQARVCSTLPDVWCGSLGGYISGNMTCPADPYNCPGGCFGADESAKEGANGGSEAGKNSQLNEPDSGGAASPAGSSDQARSQGGSSGASEGLSRAADAGAGSSDGGIDEVQKDSLSNTASDAGAKEGATKQSVQGEVVSACSDMGLTPQQCLELGIAAGAGFDSGADSAEAAYKAAKYGPSDQGSAAICNGSDCLDQFIDSADPSVDSTAFVNCPAFQMPNPSGGFPSCINNPSIDPHEMPCYPSIQNNFCTGSLQDNKRFCAGGGLWNNALERCDWAVKTTDCPSGTVRGSDGVCRKSSSSPQTITCPSGSTFNGVYCAANQSSSSSTSQSTSQTTTNSNGSTTTTTVTNNYYPGGSSGSGDSSGGDTPSPEDSTSFSGGGTCSSPPVCDGDAATCGVAYQSWLLRCSGDPLDASLPSGSFDIDAAKSDVQLAKDEYQALISDIRASVNSTLGLSLSDSVGGIAPAMVSTRWGDVDVSWHRFQSELSILGSVIIALCSLLSAFIILRK